MGEVSKVRKPIIGVIFRGVDVTSDITVFLKSFFYRDKLDNDSPDIEIELDDREQIWQNEWFPVMGDTISIFFKYEGENEVLNADNFEIDLLEFSFDNEGDTLRINAQQTPFSKNLREKRSQEYENVDLIDIVKLIGERQGLTVRGQVYDVRFDRITQNEESDLEFLTRISKDYGHLFKIEGENLIFYNWFDLNRQNPEFILTRKEITQFDAKKKLTGIYSSAKIVYEGVNGETITGAIINANPPNNSKDVLVINEKVESDGQAIAKAQEKLREANADEWSGSLTVEGECRYIAGVNFSIKGFGEFDGVWQIQEVEHEFSPSDGWVSFLEVYKVR